MNRELENKKLNEVCAFEKNNRNGKNLPYVGLEDIESNTGKFIGSLDPRSVKSSTFYFTPEHILYGRLRPYLNKVLLPSFTGHCSTEIFPIKVNSSLDRKYLFYWISSDSIVQKINHTSTGARMPRANMNEFLNFEIPLPPIPEQKRIVQILDKAFAAIAKAKANAEKNLKNAKELVESYLQSVFENKGGGWEEKTLGEIADVEYGFTDKSTEDGDYRYVRITDIDKNGELILEDKKYIKHSKEAEGFLIYENDLLMARTGATFAKVLLFNGNEPSVFASYLIRIKFKEKIENALYWYFSKTKNYWEQANSLQSGSAQPHFNGSAVKQVIFSYPKSVNEQKVLIEKFESLSIETKKLAAIYLKKLEDLEELKKSILQKAFDGQLTRDN